MRYSLKLTYRRYVKGYGFLSFAKKIGDKYGKKLMNTATKAGINAAKSFGDKYGKNLMDTAKNKELILLKQLVKKLFKRVQKLLEIWLEIKWLIKLLH